MAEFLLGLVSGFIGNLLFAQFVVSMPEISTWYARRQGKRTPPSLRERLTIEFENHADAIQLRGKPVKILLEAFGLRIAAARLRCELWPERPQRQYFFDDYRLKLLPCVGLIIATVATAWLILADYPSRPNLIRALLLISFGEALALLAAPASASPLVVGIVGSLAANTFGAVVALIWILRLVVLYVAMARLDLFSFTVRSIIHTALAKTVPSIQPPQEPELARRALRPMFGPRIKLKVNPSQELRRHAIVDLLDQCKRDVSAPVIGTNLNIAASDLYPVLCRLEREGRLRAIKERVPGVATPLEPLGDLREKQVIVYRLH